MIEAAGFPRYVMIRGSPFLTYRSSSLVLFFSSTVFATFMGSSLGVSRYFNSELSKLSIQIRGILGEKALLNLLITDEDTALALVSAKSTSGAS